jgi:hypothetical protein
MRTFPEFPLRKSIPFGHIRDYLEGGEEAVRDERLKRGWETRWHRKADKA